MEYGDGTVANFGWILERGPTDATDHAAVAEEDWERIPGVRDLEPGGEEPQFEDVTTHDTVRGITRESPHLITLGETTFTLIFNVDEPTHIGPNSLRADKINRVRRPYRMRMPDDANTIYRRGFAYVSKADPPAPVDGVMKQNCGIRFSDDDPYFGGDD
jgi:hypothetical protein